MVGVVEGNVVCTDEELSIALADVVVDIDEAIRVLMIEVLAREGFEEVSLELVLSIVDAMEDTVGCTDDELSMAGMVNDDEAI